MAANRVWFWYISAISYWVSRHPIWD